MRQSQLYPRTRREDPSDATSPGTILLIRGGYIDQLAAGIWILAPLGLMVLKRVEEIVRQEMNAAGAVELEISILHPQALWEETGRWNLYQKKGIAFTTTDRRGQNFIIAPTAEEPITDFARRHLASWRDMPSNFYQIGWKYRNEVRTRQGLIRAREFKMKDAYSFDVDEAGMNASFNQMDRAYQRVFSRCGFDYLRVEADSGTIGGSGSAEFMAVTEHGEDVLLYCPACNYGGNQEKASAHFSYPEESEVQLEKIETPNIRTVEELTDFLAVPANKMVKTIVMVADGKPVIVSMRGDLQISEVKLANLLKAEKVETAPNKIVEEVTGAPVGFAGPINLFGKTKNPYFFDSSVQGIRNFLCGANEADVHFVNVNAGRDFPEITEYHDLSAAVAGLHCGSCQDGVFEERRGIELGHIFKLQQAYSKPMRATFSNEKGEATNFWMGCYGIGVSRVVQSIVEQSNDERGIIWPWALTPFQAVVIPANAGNMKDGETVYGQLSQAGFRVLFDDRDERIGVKFNDAELLGWPFQVVVGRDWQKNGKLEVRARNLRDFDRSVFEATDSLPKALLTVDELIEYLRIHSSSQEERGK